MKKIKKVKNAVVVLLVVLFGVTSCEKKTNPMILDLAIDMVAKNPDVRLETQHTKLSEGYVYTSNYKIYEDSRLVFTIDINKIIPGPQSAVSMEGQWDTSFHFHKYEEETTLSYKQIKRLYDAFGTPTDE
jgi:hypothetical protein